MMNTMIFSLQVFTQRNLEYMKHTLSLTEKRPRILDTATSTSITTVCQEDDLESKLKQ